MVGNHKPLSKLRNIPNRGPRRREIQIKHFPGDTLGHSPITREHLLWDSMSIPTLDTRASVWSIRNSKIFLVPLSFPTSRCLFISTVSYNAVVGRTGEQEIPNHRIEIIGKRVGRPRGDFGGQQTCDFRFKLNIKRWALYWDELKGERNQTEVESEF